MTLLRLQHKAGSFIIQTTALPLLVYTYMQTYDAPMQGTFPET
jgi:hypothetical protein